MVHNFVNGEQAIALAIDMYNISVSDWVSRSPYWLIEVLNDTKVLSETPILKTNVKGSDYEYKLPCDLKALRKVTYNNRIIRNYDIVTNVKHSGLVLTDVSYTALQNGYIRMNTNNPQYKNAEITLYYRGFPTQLSKVYNIEMPMIPDNSEWLKAAATYILLRVIMRGYKHPVYSLQSNNQITNPYVLYYGIDNRGGLKQKARNAVKSMSFEEFRSVMGKINSVVLVDRDDNIDFDTVL